MSEVDFDAPFQMITRSGETLWPVSIGWFDLTLPVMTQNLTLDEVLLTDVDAEPTKAVLRFWEAPDYCVVLGRSNRAETEVNLEACRADGVPLYRRSSGGGAVVLGPGCLVYSLVFPVTESVRSLGVAALTQKLMNQMALGLRAAAIETVACGTSDLTLAARKFSGNSQRWLGRAFLHHGTILYGFDLLRIGRYLRQPTLQPNYRDGREHGEFVTNVHLQRATLLQLVATIWHAAARPCDASTVLRAEQLSDFKYSNADWTLVL